MIRWLHETSREEISTAGGKGANLGEMLRLGLPVPPGFCVTTAAYSRQVSSWDLHQRLAPLVGQQEWEAASQAAAEAFAQLPLDGPLAEELFQAYRRLGSPAVAVRSSATAEDLESASFAGQQESFLGVQGEEALLAAVRDCWASLWSPRALHYRHQRGIDHFAVSMAVVVQQMVPAGAAGVLFTVDPVAMRADRMLVEAAPGLGEAIVSGHTTGDRYRVSRSDGLAVVDRETAQPARPALDDGQVLALCRLGLALEAHFGCPQDVEFAVAGGKVWLLQSRPITTLGSVEPEPIPPQPRPGFLQRFVDTWVLDRYPTAPRPLDYLALGMLAGATVHVLRHSGYAVSAAEEANVRRWTWRTGYPVPRARPTLRVFGYSGLVARALQRDWAAWWSGEPSRALKEAGTPVRLADLPDQVLLDQMTRLLDVWQRVMNQRMEIVPGLFSVHWLRPLVTLAVGRRRAGAVMADLLAGLQTRTSEVNLALWRLARSAHASGSEVAAAVRQGRCADLAHTREGRAYLKQVAAFLAEYGHREGSIWWLSTPTWRQDPSQVWQLLQGLADVTVLPADTGAERYETARCQVEKGLRYWPWLPRFFRWLVERYRGLQAFRENSHFDLTRPLDALQAAVAECAARLARRGVISAEPDIFFLSGDEVRAYLTGEAPPPGEVRHLLARRRATYQVVNGLWQARQFRVAAVGTDLKGVGASAGVVRGRARIVRGPDQFHRLRRGEVLVCPFTTPAWTPLFASAAAVVTEIGGAASHAAIVAREYGIPAVMGVPGATGRIADGQEVLVDGNQGRVVLGEVGP